VNHALTLDMMEVDKFEERKKEYEEDKEDLRRLEIKEHEEARRRLGY